MFAPDMKWDLECLMENISLSYNEREEIIGEMYEDIEEREWDFELKLTEIAKKANYDIINFCQIISDITKKPIIIYGDYNDCYSVFKPNFVMNEEWEFECKYILQDKKIKVCISIIDCADFPAPKAELQPILTIDEIIKKDEYGDRILKNLLYEAINLIVDEVRQLEIYIKNSKISNYDNIYDYIYNLKNAKEREGLTVFLPEKIGVYLYHSNIQKVLDSFKKLI